MCKCVNPLCKFSCLWPFPLVTDDATVVARVSDTRTNEMFSYLTENIRSVAVRANLIIICINKVAKCNGKYWFIKPFQERKIVLFNCVVKLFYFRLYGHLIKYQSDNETKFAIATSWANLSD